MIDLRHPCAADLLPVLLICLERGAARAVSNHAAVSLAPQAVLLRLLPAESSRLPVRLRATYARALPDGTLLQGPQDLSLELQVDFALREASGNTIPLLSGEAGRIWSAAGVLPPEIDLTAWMAGVLDGLRGSFARGA